MSEIAPSAALQVQFASLGLDWIVPDWPVPSNVRAFSTSRNGEKGTSFDLSRRAEGNDARRRLRRWLPKDPLWLAQVHGADVVDIDRIDAESSPEAPPRADAAVTRGVGTVCAVLTADCLPVLLTDRRGSIVAAAHAGWRGIAAGVLEATLTAMGTNSQAIIAWFGPAIGPQAFEVGADVLEAHCAWDPGAADCFVPRSRDRWLADLYALARRRLQRAGVMAIYGGGRCTFSEHRSFFSYRRGGTDAAGRMATLIWRDAP